LDRVRGVEVNGPGIRRCPAFHAADYFLSFALVVDVWCYYPCIGAVVFGDE